jgi:hypothetical protein
MAGEAATMTSDTPSRPIRNVTTEAGEFVNAAESNPVTVAWAHSAGFTVTPCTDCLLVLTSGSAPYLPSCAAPTGATPFTLVSRASRSCMAEYDAGMLVPGMLAAAIPAEDVALAPDAALPEPPPQPVITTAVAAVSAAAVNAPRACRFQ